MPFPPKIQGIRSCHWASLNKKSIYITPIFISHLCLSRTLSFSPPNLRVSGGHLLLHGGSPPLHHGGYPPLHRGGPGLPLRLGFLSSLIHCPSPSPTSIQPRHIPKHPPIHLHLTLTEIDPYQKPKPPRYPLHTSPLSFLPSFSPSASYTYRHHHNPIPPPQINPVKVAFAAFRFVMSSIILLSQPCSAAAPSRPPPEPPPPGHDLGMADYVTALRNWCSGPLRLRQELVLCHGDGLSVLRPPPKPPWTHHRFSALLRFYIVFAVSMVGLLLPLLLNNARPRYALILFDKSPHKVSGVVCILLSAIWHLLIEVEEDYVGSTNCLSLPKYLSAIEYQGNWLNPQNNISRNAPFRSQKSSGLDLEKKTRVSLSVITKDWERKLLILWLLDWHDWVVYVPIVFNHAMSCAFYVYEVLVELMILGCGWEMSQHICFHSTCNGAYICN